MLNFLLGRSNFNRKEQVIESIRTFERFSECEDIEKADALLMFKSDTQQCWLVFTNLRMYFVIDDTEKSLLKTLWARDKENIVVDGRIDLHLKEVPYSKETGKLYFGKMNNSVLYTHSLFSHASLSGIILALANRYFLEK
ncbi:hypothetical protein [Vibrio rhizosphaerae]|uniref:hypothetical protein n=1 Tax=Vibrio rhizosphaerae TaxID=398736 RepID=UPI000570CA54|nr:hypothetical protein [Vibrio rhizosphaerae]